MRAYPRERFSTDVSLTPSMVGAFATAAGDDNPIHHDAAFAANTRFGRPTASGPHTTALLLALTASHFSKKGAMLGLEFWVRFRRPVYADETISLEWLVVKVTPNENFGARSLSCAVVSEVKTARPPSVRRVAPSSDNPTNKPFDRE